MIKVNWPILFREMMEFIKKHLDALCGQNTGFLNVAASGIYSCHWALRD
jgi:hypothetical protein